MKGISLAAIRLLIASADARSQSHTAARTDPAAIPLYQQTHARLVDRIRPGLRATVHMEQPDGTAS